MKMLSGQEKKQNKEKKEQKKKQKEKSKQHENNTRIDGRFRAKKKIRTVTIGIPNTWKPSAVPLESAAAPINIWIISPVMPDGYNIIKSEYLNLNNNDGMFAASKWRASV